MKFSLNENVLQQRMQPEKMSDVLSSFILGFSLRTRILDGEGMILSATEVYYLFCVFFMSWISLSAGGVSCGGLLYIVKRVI